MVNSILTNADVEPTAGMSAGCAYGRGTTVSAVFGAARSADGCATPARARVVGAAPTAAGNAGNRRDLCAWRQPIT